MPRQGDSTLVEVLPSQKCHFMIAVVPGFSTINGRLAPVLKTSLLSIILSLILEASLVLVA